MKLVSISVVVALLPLSVAGHPNHDKTVQEPPPALLPTATRSSTEFQNEVSVTIEGDFRVIRANGIPNHPTGAFPNRGNPNRISPQEYLFRVPLNPKVATEMTRLGMQPFGIAVNGIVFDPSAAEWWQNDRGSGWQYEPMSGAINLGVDQNNAHVQPSGAYHYHAIPSGLLDRLGGNQNKMILVGWAADGFPIYSPWCPSDAKDSKSVFKKMKSSYRLKKGTRPSGPGKEYDGSFVQDFEFVPGSGDLDECNGRFGATPDFPQGTYYYVLTEDFPFIPRMFRGTPDPSFARKGPGPGRRDGRPRRRAF